VIITIAKENYEVQYVNNAWEITNALAQSRASFFTYDLETTGLHIKKDRPFLGAICFNHQVYVFPTEKGIMQHLPKWAKMVKRIVNHHITYDMHMTANVIGDEAVLEIRNQMDTMGLCRLTFEAISARDGGDSLKLKAIGKKYIDDKADHYEKEVKAWLKKKTSDNRKVLMAFLKGEGWTMKKFEEYMKNGWEFPPDIQRIYSAWQEEYPNPTYKSVPMGIMLPYVAVDVILAKILVLKCTPVIKNRKQEHILQQECDLLPVVFRMERAGIKTDIEYLKECGKKMDGYIEKMYTQLYEIVGQEFSADQHAFIKKLYEGWLGKEVASTDKAFLKKMADKFKDDKVGIAASLITRIRRFTKWRQTYIERIIEVASYDGRFYTSMNPYNPISGRFSGDSQQMPKDAIMDENGEEIFHPRRAFTVSGDGYNEMYFLDFSQVELRMQAHYTLPFGGDVNMCRAYMPYHCFHYRTGEEYNFQTIEGRGRWNEKQEDGETSAWIEKDTNEPWVATDVHLATTLKALVAMGHDPKTMDKKEIKWWRKKGKIFNFMRNYGGGDKKAAETLDIPMEAASALNKGYTDAFPVVVTYQNNVVVAMSRKGYAYNSMGRRYYLYNPNKFYKVANYIIQGSCADDLKKKMIKIDTFLLENHYKTRLILCIHDELVFEVYDGEAHIISEIKKMMEDTPNVLVPIIAEVEKTKTCWADKKGE
jgi:DNA polymerase-1